MNKECLRQPINTIQSKDHRIETYEINKICLVLMIKYTSKNNGYDGLALGY